MYAFPREPKKIRATIKRYERALRKEREETGSISDGFGKRYLLGILYMLLGDTSGAVKSFEWFERTFEDDGSEPFHSLIWTLALYRAGRKEEASRKLRHSAAVAVGVGACYIPETPGCVQSGRDGRCRAGG